MNDPRHEVLDWKDKKLEFDGLVVVPCERCSPTNLGSTVGGETLGAVLPESDVDGYFEQYKRGEHDVPPYYSDFPEPNRDLLVQRPIDDEDFSTTGLDGQSVEAALRALNGGGRYDEDKYILHDCLPMPSLLQRMWVGYIVITPVLRNDDRSSSVGA